MYRTVLIGVDGATFSVLDALVSGGQMPHLAAFMSNGVRAELLSTPHPLTPPAWTTLMTGRTPGNHGIFDFIWTEERTDEVYFTLNNFRDIQAETVWSIVSRNGGTVTSLNFPHMTPPPEINGTVIPGLVSWKHLRRNVHPRQRFNEIKQLPGFDVKEVAWDFDHEKRATQVIPASEHEPWVAFHNRREKQWYEIFHYLARSHPCDLTAILIDGVDKLQHVCWRYIDPNYADTLSSTEELAVKDLCVEYFRNLDKFIGDTVAWAGPEARVFIASDHGFGPTRDVFRLNLWLQKKGYLSFVSTEDMSESEKQKVERLVTRHFVHLDWKNTIAYSPSAATNGIVIRRKSDSGPGGIPDSEYAACRDRLIDELLQIRHPESGTQVIRKVMTREEVFPGDHNRRCPDLTVQLHDYGFVSTLNKEPVHWSRPDVAGTHRPEGVFLATGPGIKSGRSLSIQSIVDITPTLLFSLGLAVPSDTDGGVIADAFEPAYMEAHPAEAAPPTLPPDTYVGKEARASAEEQKSIIERLRALGYVE
ncbi:MAG: alkaline phosphatase family protein [Planctomycetota bacterium]